MRARRALAATGPSSGRAAAVAPLPAAARHATMRRMSDRLNTRTARWLLAFFVLLIGIWPEPLVHVMQASVENLVQHISQSKLMGLSSP